MKLAVSILVLFSCLFIEYSQSCSAAENVGLVTLDVANEPLGQVARRIAYQTGYNIVILEDWKKVSISGRFINVPVDEFFRRALKGLNIFLTVDEKRKQIIVRAVGYDSSRKFAVVTVKGTTTGNEQEVTPGMRLMDVVDGPAYGPDVDPMDLEVTPGIRRRDVVEDAGERTVDSMDLEVTPGMRRMDVVDGPAYGPDVDPMDLEVTPGIRRRDVVKGTMARLVVQPKAVKPMLPPFQNAADNR